MAPNVLYLLLAALGMVLLTFLVGTGMLYSRVQEMRGKRLHPQTAATTQTLTGRLENVQAADNFRNLFESPVLFYALVACAIAVSWVPPWLVIGAWCYLGLRIAHSLIHCTYNRGMHRLAMFALSFVLVVALWLVYVLALLSKGVL